MDKDIEDDEPKDKLISLKGSDKEILTLKGSLKGMKLKPYIEHLCEEDSNDFLPNMPHAERCRLINQMRGLNKTVKDKDLRELIEEGDRLQALLSKRQAKLLKMAGQSKK